MVSPEQPSPAEAQDIREIEWTPYAELHLINSLGGLKAIGINHHFCMAIAWHRFTSAMHMNVSAEALRKRLEMFYDFANAEKLVGEIPFPNDEVEFSLPEDEFPGLRLEPPAEERTFQQPPSAKRDSVVSGKRFSSPVIPKSRTPVGDSARKDRAMFPKDVKQQRSSSPLNHGTWNAIGPTSSLATRKEVKQRTVVADEPTKRKNLAMTPGGSAVTADKRESATTTSSSSSSATMSTSSPLLQRKLYKDSRVVLTKGRSFDELLLKRGIRIDEEKRAVAAATATAGKKRQGRLSESKPASPTPSKRARH